MQILKILLGFLFLVLGWSLLFRTGLIFRLNAWFKENVFNDQLVLYSRRRISLLLFFLGIISLFSGIDSVMKDPMISVEGTSHLLEEAQGSFKAKDYKRVVKICRTILKRDSDNIPARELEINALYATGEKDDAQRSALILINFDPQNESAKKILAKTNWNKRGKKH